MNLIWLKAMRSVFHARVCRAWRAVRRPDRFARRSALAREAVAAKRQLCGVGLALLLHFLPRLAGAHDVAIVDLKLFRMPPALRAPLSKALAEAFSAVGHRVVEARKRRKADVSASCIAGPCVAQLGAIADAQWALLGSVAAVGSSYDVALTLIDRDGGVVIAQRSARCDVCTYNEVLRRLAAIVRRLSAAAVRYVAAHGRLHLQSDPPGAEVHLDGVPIGQTPVRRLVSAGRHHLTLLLAGLRVARVIQIERGKTLQIDQRMSWLRRQARPRKRWQLPNWVGWLSLVGGAVAATGGAAVWGVARDCDGGCTGLRQTVGASLVGVGAAALAFNVAMLAWDYWRPHPR